jgi:hypothetical protein
MKPAKRNNTPFAVYVRVLIDRPHLKAIQVTDGTREAWLPKSLIKFLSRYNNLREVEIEIPEWLAREKGFL